MSTDAKRKANAKYLNGFEEIQFRVKKGEKEKIIAFGKTHGTSFNSWIVDLVKRAMESSEDH